MVNAYIYIYIYIYIHRAQFDDPGEQANNYPVARKKMPAPPAVPLEDDACRARLVWSRVLLNGCR